MTERIQKLTALIKHTDIFGEQTAVEYDPMDLALPTAVFNAKRITEFILAQKPYLTDSNRFPGVLHYYNAGVPGDLFSRVGHSACGAAIQEFYCKHRDNLVVFEWQHSTPDYEKIIRFGVEKLLWDIAFSKETHKYEKDKLDFLSGVEIVCKGVTERAARHAEVYRAAAKETADKTRKDELNALADALENVPAKPARSFYEGLIDIIFCFSYLPDSIGTIDRFLYPLYKQDIDNGTLTREQAKDLIQEVFTYICAFTPYNCVNNDRGAECHFAIGGYTEDGEDGYNELSDLIVEALMDLDTLRPQISLRWTKKTPFEVLEHLLKCERDDKYKRLAFVSDEPHIPSFEENLGINRSQAVRYTMVGCNEPAFQGSVWYGGTTANIARSIEKTLYEHEAEAVGCESFEEFFSLYRAVLKSELDEIIRYDNAFNEMRAKDINVLSAFLFNGCIESGVSPTQCGTEIKIGGANLMGLTTVIDSLSIIKQFVYDEKQISMECLIDTLKQNWQNNPVLHTKIMKTGKFFGNSYPLSDEMAARFTTTLWELTTHKRLDNGAHILFGTLAGYHPHFAFFGKTTRATPDGRYDGETFVVGSGQGRGKDREGIAALLASVAKMDPKGILCGPFVCNLMVDEALVKNDAYFAKLCKTIETYFKQGGMHVQLNYLSAGELKDALEHPENYQSLRVRVSGYSGTFVKLEAGIQDEILHRTLER